MPHEDPVPELPSVEALDRREHFGTGKLSVDENRIGLGTLGH